MTRAPTPFSAPELAAFEASVRSSDDANQLGLVAWYAFKRANYREALDWFKLSISHGGDADDRARARPYAAQA